MTVTEMAMRQERAREGVLIASRVDGGFRVYSTENPAQQYRVAWNGERLTCTCPDFEFHKSDSRWRCKHILALEPAEAGGVPELPEEAEEVTRYAGNMTVPSAAPAGDPTNGASSRRRRSPKETSPPTSMLIKRSVSPDGRIDSVSVEFTMPVVDLTIGEIKDKALNTLQLQREIVASFLSLNGHATPEPQSPALQQPAPSQPALAERIGEGAPIFATMLDIGKVNGKWGDRLCIVFDMQGSRTRLFGSPKQLAEHIGSAGYAIRPEDITAGRRLNLPCRITTKPSDDGKYVNVEQVFAAPRQGANGGWNGGRAN
jgi:hypothetical protein